MAVSKFYLNPFDPTLEIKGKIFKIRKNLGILSIFLLKFCMQAEQQ